MGRVSRMFIFLILVGIFIILGLSNYLLFHSLTELISISIGMAIFLIAVNTIDISENDFFVFLGIAYGFVGLFDLLHLLSYQGMGVIANTGANMPTQLWIAARFTESLSILYSFRFLKKDISLKYKNVIAFYIFIFVLTIMSIVLNLFPDCYINGSGLTLFKIISEYIIIIILSFTFYFTRKYRNEFMEKTYRYIILAIFVTMISEIAFTLYYDVYGLSNMFGHILKLISFYFIYKAIIETTLVKPYHILFRDLQKQASTDPLTGVMNRRSGIDYLEKQIEYCRVNNKTLSICFADINDFKMINDQYGHNEGDNVLRIVARNLQYKIRDNDIVCRFGGDEFLLIFPDCSGKEAMEIRKRIAERLVEFNKKSTKSYQINICYGIAELRPEQNISVDKLISIADTMMYEQKKKVKRNKLK